MKTIQQRRPFFLTTATNSFQGIRRPRGWLAVILSAALLCCSCASLTPDRVQFWADLARQAAQVGLQIWLAKHPEHRGNIAEILAAMGRLSVQPPGLESGVTEEQLLAALPTRVLTGEKAELFLTDKSVLIRDKKSGKSKLVDAENREPVMRAIRQGMRDALTPKPPMPERTRRVAPVAQPPHVIYVTNQQVIVLPPNEPAFAVAPKPVLVHAPVVESPTPAVPAGKHSPRGRVGIFTVERRSGTNEWVEVQSFTGPASEYRVRRVR